jgi:hypothetical protein
MASARVGRGRATQQLLADYLISHGWLNAKSRPASLPGTDVYDVPFAPEVKATAGQDFTGALRQAKANCNGLLPFVVYRPRGYGPEKIGQWLVVFALEDATELLKKAGYQ